ncbi:MAG: ATP-binding protein [Thermodesulfobacteriota bacterium]
MSVYHRKLRCKMIVLTLSFSLIPLFVLGATFYYQFSSAYEGMVLESIRNRAQNRVSALELFFEERVAQLTVLVMNHSYKTLSDEEFLNQLFESMQSRSKSYTDLGLIDADGNHVAYVGPFYEKLKHVNYVHEPWFSAVMSSGLFISDVFSGFRKVPHFIIAVRRIEGNRTWILRATVNSDIIDKIVRTGQLGRKGDAFLVNYRNELQTSPRFSGELLSKPRAPDFSSTAGTIVEKVKFEGESYLFAASALANPRWVMVIREDLSEKMAPLFEASYLEGVIGGLGILLVVVGTLFTTRSMTNELIRMEHEKGVADHAMMQAAKMAALGKMAAGVAHEINNPLQIIGDQAGWMKDLLAEEEFRESANYEELTNCLKKIERNLERCRSITHRMLRFGRRMEPALEEVDVHSLIDETITFLENEARFREIHIETQYAEKVPHITTDRAQLQQVFLNIIDNGLDAVGRGGMIRVKTSYNSGIPGEVIIEFTDNGPGIPKDMLSKVFDPFFSTKPANGGTGLGLSISYSIIEKLGGKISVESDGKHGATFTIRLPVK